MKKNIETAVIAAGGYGTRFLPFTKVVPKELLPLGDTPTIELLVRECVVAGVKKIFIIVRSDSDIIQKHFSDNIRYEEYLEEADKKQYVDKISSRSFEGVQMVFVKEDESLPYGNARGLFSIKDELMGEDAFLLLFGDDIVLGGESSIKGIINKYMERDCDAVVGVQRVPILEVPRYGNVQLREGTVDEVEAMIQKPRPENVISDLVIYSQLVLTPTIFNYLGLDKIENGELDAGVALGNLARDKKLLTYVATGTWVTIGDPVNYIRANLFKMVSDGAVRKEAIQEYLNLLE